MFKIVVHGHLSKSAVFDRFSQRRGALGLQGIFQSARGLGGPVPCFIGGRYVRFSMADLPLLDVMTKIVGHRERGHSIPIYIYRGDTSEFI
jgi:hypothetical protein